MRKPTREEVRKAVDYAADWPVATSGARARITDAVMALLEDKPLPKWEKELRQLFHVLPSNRGCFEPPFVMACETDRLKDFIRKTLREFSDDIEGHIIGSDKYNSLKKKYGL